MGTRVLDVVLTITQKAASLAPRKCPGEEVRLRGVTEAEAALGTRGKRGPPEDTGGRGEGGKSGKWKVFIVAGADASGQNKTNLTRFEFQTKGKSDWTMTLSQLSKRI